MAASRKFERISIFFIEDSENPGAMIQDTVEVVTVVEATEQGLTVTAIKSYSQYYGSLGPVAKARIDAFVSDVSSFIDSQEPIV